MKLLTKNNLRNLVRTTFFLKKTKWTILFLFILTFQVNKRLSAKKEFIVQESYLFNPKNS